jgi:hypothetical protein
VSADRPHGVDACGAGDVDVDMQVAEELGPCPSCAEMLMTSYEPHPGFDGQMLPTVIHPIPFCDYFGQTEADQIVSDMLNAGQAKEGIS